jgi:C1A family cysteine protease
VKKGDDVMKKPLARLSLLALSLALCLLLTTGAAAARAGRTPSADSVLHASMAPLSPAFLRSLVGPPLVAPSSVAGGHTLGGRPAPQDFSYTRGMRVPSARETGTLPATYDLRTLGRVTPVKDQDPYGACWAFASCGSLESCLLPGTTWDFSEDNMILTSGFDWSGSPYDAGGHFAMSTAYLVRWGGPVDESEDAYGDNYTPPGLTPRKHVQEVDWIPLRGSALDNDNVKNAVMRYGGVMASFTWDDSSYNAATASYYYNGSADLNHDVLIVGWNDNYPAADFATTPPGNGAFIIKNSWGRSFGDNGYNYVSYYDSKFGRANNLMAVFDKAEPTSNYIGIYQYDPLGDVMDVGFSSSTAWFANVFTARATSSLSAVGFYTQAPGTRYQVYTGGSSLATRTLRTSGTLPYMGYHTVTLPSAVGIASGQPFVVAVKVTSPGTDYPIAAEYPVAGYSSAATAAAGQSYVSPDGSSWTDITSQYANTNVCLKAYVKAPVAPRIAKLRPKSARRGALVTISGTNFGARTSTSAVKFGTAKCTRYVSWTGTRIKCRVPARARYRKVKVTVTTTAGKSNALTFRVRR